jgi:hypothetical protein
MVLNDRTIVHVHQTRGGILVQDSLRAENDGGDSFGRFSYRNYFGAHSRWTRQTVLTREGHLIVRDVYEPGADTDGFQAGPVWCLKADGKETGRDGRGRMGYDNKPPGHDGERSWFDAPAWDHAWWQKRKKRVLVYIHPAPGQTYGQVQHVTTPDVSRRIRTNSSYARAVVAAGVPKVFLSVLVPHGEDEKPEAVAGRVRTAVDGTGAATASVHGVRIRIGHRGEWRVRR